MPEIFIKLKNKSQNVLLQSLLGTYSHLMWVRTEDPEKSIVKIVTTSDLYEETTKVLDGIKADIEYEIIEIIR